MRHSVVWGILGGDAVWRGFRARAAHTRRKIRPQQVADVDGHGDPDRLGQSVRPRADEGGWQAAADLVGRRTGWSDSWPRKAWSETSLKAGDVIRVEGFPARNKSNQISGKALTLTSTGRPVYIGTNGTPSPFRSRRDRRRSGLTVTRGSGRRPDRLVTGDIRARPASSRTASPCRWTSTVCSRTSLTPPRSRRCSPGRSASTRCDRACSSTTIRCTSGANRRADRVSSNSLTGFSSSSSRISSACSSFWAAATATAALYTDGRKQVGQLQGNDDYPLFYGYAGGRFEGDTFVVDTRGFIEEFWFDNGGLPHTEQLHLVEQFTRTDMGTMYTK